MITNLYYTTYSILNNQPTFLQQVTIVITCTTDAYGDSLYYTT